MTCLFRVLTLLTSGNTPRRQAGRSRAPVAIVAATIIGAATAQAGVNVPTYHGDAARTGWNSGETSLTPQSLAGGGFKQLANVQLDDQVDGQPLFMSAQTIGGRRRDVVYLATESNSVYAIDAQTGEILVRTTLGPAVPRSALPGQCNNNGSHVGINSTPVIDPVSKTLYAMTFTYESGTPIYRMHALDLATLRAKVPSVVVNASAKLTDGSDYRFNAGVERQRPGLLLANGDVYAAFGSFCDNSPFYSRGWILGWKADSLNPLPLPRLNDRLATSPKTYFLNSVWMSGYGLAADPAGYVYLVTGNSDPAAPATADPRNRAESVLKLSPNLYSIQSYFTPGTAANGRAALDKVDDDFGAGGAMVLPPQPGRNRNLAVAAGKVGIMYLMDRDNLGQWHNDGIDHVLDQVNIGKCFCGPSYYRGADGVGRIVTSGAKQVIVWKVVTSPDAAPRLVKESTSAALSSGQDSGFFTSISSYGRTAGSQVIWALSRPTTATPATIMLYAFDPSTVNGTGQSASLVSLPAGSWVNVDGNANLVPLVANGRVFVASYKQLAIFGLPTATAAATVPSALADTAADDAGGVGHSVYGKLVGIDATTITIETRTGKRLVVNPAAARRTGSHVQPAVGTALLVIGDYDRQGVFQANSILKAKNAPEMWRADR